MTTIQANGRTTSSATLPETLDIKSIKQQSVKDFAEKLKTIGAKKYGLIANGFGLVCPLDPYVTNAEIDALVKEYEK